MPSYLRLHVQVRPAAEPQDSDDPPLAPPLVRRVLGKALIEVFCPFGEPCCQARQARGSPRATPEELCHLAKSCPYGVLFAGSLSGRPPFALHIPDHGSESSGLIEVSLFGPGWRSYPWLLSALQRALAGGLGKARRRWEIEQVLRVDPDRGRQPLCDGDLSTLSPTVPPAELELSVEQYIAPRRVAVELLSPTRLLRDGKLVRGGAPVFFELLIARILDRFRGLYGATPSELLRPQVRAVIESEAARVPLISDQTRWVEVADYSARSDSELLFGGKIGRLVYGEEAARFLPILRAGEIVHLGKNPTSGCGRMRVDFSPA